ncbi:MAG: phosphatidylinositol-specific phospholipase C/glycerophosphodiester phosphodiesterase family protein [Tannerella sp.]|jgi:alkaline phosphatase|nr:phosphatidylinositol-specific phospholipase C/glycerophosphodiester phosphodiesterase family protein [Tannerella sp.]
MKSSLFFVLTLAGSLCLQAVFAQEIKIHSHNDYNRRTPFYQAYAQQVASIEADIFATKKADELLVAHDRKDLPEAPTLDEAYIRPLVRLYRQNGGRAWKQSDRTLVLLVDLKTPVSPTLDRLVTKLQASPDVFDPQVNPFAVRVVISGNVPDAEAFASWPPFIFFDGSRTDYTPRQLERIYMISLNLRNYTKWDGEGSMSEKERNDVVRMIEAVHALGKPIRFWGTPDSPTAWRTFHSLGVDYINTDRPEACAAFFRDSLASPGAAASKLDCVQHEFVH